MHGGTVLGCGGQKDRGILRHGVDAWSGEVGAQTDLFGGWTMFIQDTE